MYLRLLLFLGITLSIKIHTSAQIFKEGLGAATHGLGGVITVGNHTESIFNNIAGISSSESIEAISTLRSQYNGFFVSMGFGLNLPHKYGNTAFSAIRFGDDIYSEQQFSVAYAVQNEGVQIGIRSNLLQVTALGFGTDIAASFDFGVITQLYDNLWLGAYATNITQTSFNTQDQVEPIPATISLGFKYQPLQKFTIQADVFKEIEQAISFRTGAEYQLSKNLLCRTGINSATKSIHWGLSFLLRKSSFHYALSNVTRLGNTHQISFVYQFKRIKKKANSVYEGK